MQDRSALNMEESRLMDMTDAELTEAVQGNNAFLRFASNVVGIIEHLFEKITTKKCPLCNGATEFDIASKTEPDYWVECDVCKGEGRVKKS